MQKLNCWEFKQCGRESGGHSAGRAGVCPAARDARLDGVHGGACAGRSCWMLDGTICDSSVQGNALQKMKKCMSCGFYNDVLNEERGHFKMSAVLARRLQQHPQQQSQPDRQ